MSNDLKIWDLDQLKIVLCSIPVEGGYGEGEVLKLERTQPTFTTKMGADGVVTRSKTYNGHFKITLTLMQTSASNALFSALHLLDQTASNGAGVGATAITDLAGGTTYVASKSWIAEAPSPTFGREATHRDWVIETADMKGFEAGN